MEPAKPEWIAKLLAAKGLCSRREAQDYIRRGWVLLDGKPVTEPATKALPTQDLRLAKSAQRRQAQRVTVLVNKPAGYVAAQPERGYRSAIELITPANQEREPGEPSLHADNLRGLAPAGRLDIEAQGLQVYTQDGRVARTLIGQGGAIEREYLVRLRQRINDRQLGWLRKGLVLDGIPLAPATVGWVNQDQLKVAVVEGKHRMIQRMMEAVGGKVAGIKRVRIGRVPLGGLPPGKWRFLRPGERF